MNNVTEADSNKNTSVSTRDGECGGRVYCWQIKRFRIHTKHEDSMSGVSEQRESENLTNIAKLSLISRYKFCFNERNMNNGEFDFWQNLHNYMEHIDSMLQKSSDHTAEDLLN